MPKAALLNALALLSLAPLSAMAQARPPDWFTAEMGQLATGPGVWWVASNAQYQGTNEPFPRYAIRWSAEDNGLSLSGRLVAVDTAGRLHPLWTYKLYWHPGEGRGYLMQTSSWGSYGIGPLQLDSAAARTLINDQDFWHPGGATTRTRHRSWFDGENVHMTVTQDWKEGRWVPGRTYRWERQTLGE